MSRFRTLCALISPSLSSGMLVGGTTTVVLVVQGLAFISHNLAFHDLLFGPGGINAALMSSPDVFAIIRHALNSTLAYYIAVVLAAAIIGAATYELLELGTHVTQGAVELSGSSGSALQEKLARLSVRVLALTSWAFYILFFATIYVPFTITILQNSFVQISHSNPYGWLWLVLGAIGLSISLHMHITFLRLVFLHPRLWRHDF